MNVNVIRQRPQRRGMAVFTPRTLAPPPRHRRFHRRQAPGGLLRRLPCCQRQILDLLLQQLVLGGELFHPLLQLVDADRSAIPRGAIGHQLPLQVLVPPTQELDFFLPPLVLLEFLRVHDPAKLTPSAKARAGENQRHGKQLLFPLPVLMSVPLSTAPFPPFPLSTV